MKERNKKRFLQNQDKKHKISVRKYASTCSFYTLNKTLLLKVHSISESKFIKKLLSKN